MIRARPRPERKWRCYARLPALRLSPARVRRSVLCIEVDRIGINSAWYPGSLLTFVPDPPTVLAADRVLPGQVKNAATAGVKLRSRVTVMWPRPLMRCRWLPAMSCAVCLNRAAL